MSIDDQKMAKVSTYLGVDFGVAKIGLAIADEETKMAFAFDTLENNKQFWKNLKEIIACENVKSIVVGMTKHERDEESSKLKGQFIKSLEKETELPVFLQEEMFTTLSAQQNIKLRGKKGIAALDDQEAARIILQDWLDKI